MRLNEALQIVNATNKASGPFSIIFLACGFQPLHLATFIQAHSIRRLGGQIVRIETGLFGNILSNINRAAESKATSSAVALEWEDLDARLGLRASGGWTSASQRDIERLSIRRLEELESAITKLSASIPVAVSPPSLPLPPLGHTVQLQATTLSLQLEQQLAAFLQRLAYTGSARILDPFWLACNSPPSSRLDPKMSLLTGFPYSIKHADAVASALVDLLFATPAKKGLILDLDETLWSGIVGEIGVDRVSWCMEDGSQVHAWLQQMLAQLAENGVLIAIASKNQSELVEQALSRKDLLVPRGALFPIIATWGAKSVAVQEIVRRWNIAADSVVFLDDTAMELSEVQSAVPGITCLQFTPKDPGAVWNVLQQLRNLFGKPAIFAEDLLRSNSIRSAEALEELALGTVSSKFLHTLGGRVILDYQRDSADTRPLDLINKTNQFNLNGIRLIEGDWRERMKSPTGVAIKVSYEDKFGPLGNIAALLGQVQGHRVHVTSWVMSCRAFSRRIEYHILESLFRVTGASELRFEFRPTERNWPLQNFFAEIEIDYVLSGQASLLRETFEKNMPELPHQVSEMTK